MKKIGAGTLDEEREVEVFLKATVPFVDQCLSTYGRAVFPVASPSYYGVESRCWFVASQGAEVDCFLRIGVEELISFVDTKIALKAARACHDLGVSPQVLAADTHNNATLFENLDADWRVATIDRLMVPNIAAQLVDIQKKIARLAPFGRRWCVFDAIDIFYEKLCLLDVSLPCDIDWMMGWMKEIRDSINASGVDFKPAHGDPHSSNVMINGEDRLNLIDFDMSGDMDPYYSLGVLMNELYAFEEQMKPMAEIYDGTLRESTFCRCRVYAAADDLYWTLRALFMENCSKDRSLEFLKYASWRALRCRMLLRHPDFEHYLRKI